MKKLEKGADLLGTIVHSKSMPVIEALGRTGLDFVLLDMEHCALSNAELSQGITAASAAGLPVLVRVCSGSRENILHALDLGATGIVVPGIRTVEQVRELIRHAKFMPVGERGYCMTRDGGWGVDPVYEGGLLGYMEHCNRNTLLLPQCETVGCLEHIEEIVALEGVDGILIGPNDLSLDMGIPGQFADPRHRAAIERIYAACRNSGKLSINFCGSAESARAAFAAGCDAALLGIDLLMLIGAYRKLVEEVRK